MNNEHDDDLEPEVIVDDEIEREEYGADEDLEERRPAFDIDDDDQEGEPSDSI
jgi:hypothetical protein